jgi:hypothetical protein
MATSQASRCALKQAAMSRSISSGSVGIAAVSTSGIAVGHGDVVLDADADAPPFAAERPGCPAAM